MQMFTKSYEGEQRSPLSFSTTSSLMEAMKQGLFSFDVNGEMKQIKPNEEIPEDILEVLWREQKLSAVDNPYGTCHARINGNCPHAEEPLCLTCNGGSPCKDLAIGFSELDIQKYELLIKTSSRIIEMLEQRGRQDIAEKTKRTWIDTKIS